MRRRDGEHGQAANEYVALLLVVAVVLLSLVALTAGGIGSHVLAGLQRGICIVTRGDCAVPIAPRADLAACAMERTTRTEGLSETIASVKLGTSGVLTVVRMSDGTAKVSIADGSALGGEMGLGVSLGASKGGTASLEMVWSTGRSWTFPTVAAAERFVDRYGVKATIKGQLVDDVRSACSFLCDIVGWRPHPELPTPDETFEDGGVAGKAAGSLGKLRLDASLGAVLGTRKARTGERTTFVRLDAGLSAALPLPRGVAVDGRARGKAVLGYRRDADGRPLTLTVTFAGDAAARATVAGAYERGAARANGGGSAAMQSGVVEWEATLDLSDPRNRAAADGLIDALKQGRRSVVSLGAAPPVDAPARVAALARRIDAAAQIDVRHYAVEEDAKNIGASLAIGIKVGAGFDRSAKGLRLTHAETRLPGMPFLPRDDCRTA